MSASHILTPGSNQPMKPLRVVVVDDEPFARENMRDLLAAHKEVMVVGEAGTVDEARQVLSHTRPDTVFLDIRMPGGTGFDVLSGLEWPLQVVFVTAYDAFAIRAFQVNAVDYLLKPIDRDLLAQSVRRLASRNSVDAVPKGAPDRESLPFRLDDSVLVCENAVYVWVPLRNLCAIKAYGNYTEIIDAENRTYLFRGSLKDWYARLPTPPFQKLDRSLIINTDQVSGWRLHERRMEMVFKNGDIEIFLGRTASRRYKSLIDNGLPVDF